MLTFIWIGAVLILGIVGLLMYSARNKKKLTPPDRLPITSTDVARNPNRKRATGVGED
jgi:hypothetical protein